jgi:hypothetical protein
MTRPTRSWFRPRCLPVSGARPGPPRAQQLADGGLGPRPRRATREIELQEILDAHPLGPGPRADRLAAGRRRAWRTGPVRLLCSMLLRAWMAAPGRRPCVRRRGRRSLASGVHDRDRANDLIPEPVALCHLGERHSRSARSGPNRRAPEEQGAPRRLMGRDGDDARPFFFIWRREIRPGPPPAAARLAPEELRFMSSMLHSRTSTWPCLREAAARSAVPVPPAVRRRTLSAG